MTSSRTRQPLRLMETFRSVFYTPIYVSVAGGFLEQEGLDVDFATCPPKYPHPLSALNHGVADIAQSGIMRSIIACDWGAETVPLHLAKINARDGFFVLGRKPEAEFRWDDFRSATVIPVGFTPMPWASFRYALRSHDIDPNQLTLIPDLGLDDAMAAFRQGQGDFIHLPEPAAEQVLATGDAHLAVALGKANGHIAYSSFAATNQFLTNKPELAMRFVRGYANALQWLSSHEAPEVGDAIQQFFPSVDFELIVRSVARYKDQETWPAEPSLQEPEYQGLQDILIAAGMVKERQPYNKVVRPEIVQQALAAQ
ncbi:MAG: hypothetical protein BZY88_00145 [SAR202 cluster bacterium Io17-Chloro-G9]|nr:MAG: hypothetical protein BZY88_00145 [SAR202 cluster bacterium Io17-Chloro-G9]